MKFTISWLKEYLDTNASDEAIIDKLTDIGLEVEKVQDAKDLFGAFIIAEVVEEEKHPDADKLRVCKVNVGDKVVDVVCGAPNVIKGMKVVYANKKLVPRKPNENQKRTKYSKSNLAWIYR